MFKYKLALKSGSNEPSAYLNHTIIKRLATSRRSVVVNWQPSATAKKYWEAFFVVKCEQDLTNELNTWLGETNGKYPPFPPGTLMFWTPLAE